jgi:hypothetical protein
MSPLFFVEFSCALDGHARRQSDQLKVGNRPVTVGDFGAEVLVDGGALLFGDGWLELHKDLAVGEFVLRDDGGSKGENRGQSQACCGESLPIWRDAVHGRDCNLAL